LATNKSFDLASRKNEPIFGGYIRNVFVFVHLQNLGSLVELALFGDAALGLDLAELREGPFELAGEALALGADAGEGPRVFAKCQGHGEGSFGLRVVGADAIFHFGDAEREEIGLDGGGTVETPGSIDEALGELSFGGALGLIFVQEALGVALVSGVIVGGQDNSLAREAMAQGVEGGALFTGFGAGSGGFLSVGFIRGGAIYGGAAGTVMPIGAGCAIGGG